MPQGSRRAAESLRIYSKQAGRTREVTDTGLLAFGELLPTKWQLYLSLKLHTRGRRKGELLRIQHSHLDEEGIVFVNNKRASDRFRIRWTEPLRQIVNGIIVLQPAVPPAYSDQHQDQYLFYNRQVTTRGRSCCTAWLRRRTDNYSNRQPRND